MPLKNAWPLCTIGAVVITSIRTQANNASHINTQPRYLHSNYEMQTDIISIPSNGFGAMRVFISISPTIPRSDSDSIESVVAMYDNHRQHFLIFDQTIQCGA